MLICLNLHICKNGNANWAFCLFGNVKFFKIRKKRPFSYISEKKFEYLEIILCSFIFLQFQNFMNIFIE